VVVLLFKPLYGRLKTMIDRLFFRDRYDAQRALERRRNEIPVAPCCVLHRLTSV
jgi:hypothetical protein